MDYGKFLNKNSAKCGEKVEKICKYNFFFVTLR